MALVDNTNTAANYLQHGKGTSDVSAGEKEGGFNGDMRELVDLLSKLNPAAEEFIPTSYRSSSINDGNDNNGSIFANVNRRKNRFNQGKRRVNGRTLRAQREDSVKRTVYVSDIDQQVTEEQLAGLFLNCGQICGRFLVLYQTRSSAESIKQKACIYFGQGVICA